MAIAVGYSRRSLSYLAIVNVRIDTSKAYKSETLSLRTDRSIFLYFGALTFWLIKSFSCAMYTSASPEKAGTTEEPAARGLGRTRA